MAQFNPEKLKNWLYECGFEQGLKDKDLQKPFIIFGVVLLGLYFWISMSGRTIKTVQNQIVEEQNRSKLVEDYNMALRQWDTLGRDIFVPKATDSREWVQKQITAFAAESGVEVIALEPGSPQSAGSLTSEQSKLTLQGSYHQIGGFIAKIENHKPFVGISNFQFVKANSDNGNQGNKSLTVTLTLFVIKEAQVVGSRG